MKCPFCSAPPGEVKVVETRHSQEMTRRRRVCGLCEERFSTVEVVTAEGVTVTKSKLLVVPKDTIILN